MYEFHWSPTSSSSPPLTQSAGPCMSLGQTHWRIWCGPRAWFSYTILSAMATALVMSWTLVRLPVILVKGSALVLIWQMRLLLWSFLCQLGADYGSKGLAPNWQAMVICRSTDGMDLLDILQFCQSRWTVVKMVNSRRPEYHSTEKTPSLQHYLDLPSHSILFSLFFILS